MSMSKTARAWLDLAGRHEHMAMRGRGRQRLPILESPANVGIWEQWTRDRIGDLASALDGSRTWVEVGEPPRQEIEDERGSIGYAEYDATEDLPRAAILLEAVLSWMRFNGEDVPDSCNAWWRALVAYEDMCPRSF